MEEQLKNQDPLWLRTLQEVQNYVRDNIDYFSEKGKIEYVLPAAFSSQEGAEEFSKRLYGQLPIVLGRERFQMVIVKGLGGRFVLRINKTK